MEQPKNPYQPPTANLSNINQVPAFRTLYYCVLVYSLLHLIIYVLGYAVILSQYQGLSFTVTAIVNHVEFIILVFAVYGLFNRQRIIQFCAFYASSVFLLLNGFEIFYALKYKTGYFMMNNNVFIFEVVISVIQGVALMIVFRNRHAYITANAQSV